MSKKYIDIEVALSHLYARQDEPNLDWVQELANFPAADVRDNVKGGWINFGSDLGERYGEIKCSKCHESFVVDVDSGFDIGLVEEDFNFCPNCGADMRGEEQ